MLHHSNHPGNASSNVLHLLGEGEGEGRGGEGRGREGRGREGRGREGRGDNSRSLLLWFYSQSRAI